MKLLSCLLLLVPFASAQNTKPNAAPARAEIQTPTAQQVEHMEQVLQDWPDLARYRAQNAALPLPAPGEKRVVFMGDSITDAWGPPRADFFPASPTSTAASAAKPHRKC